LAVVADADQRRVEAWAAALDDVRVTEPSQVLAPRDQWT